MKRGINIKNEIKVVVAMLFSAVSLLSSCKNNIPDDLDALGDDVLLSRTEFSPFIGRVTSFENTVNVSNKSTLPLSFKVMGMRTAEGQSASELTEKYPIKVWKSEYTAEEKSVAEIEAKRVIEYRPIFEVQEKNGDFVFWNVGNSSFIKTLPSEGYLFDLEVSNSGGRRYIRNIALKPRKERDYEPSQYDDILGLAQNSFLRPSNLINVYGKRTGAPVSDVRVFIMENKEIKTAGNTLTISVLDSLGKSIDIKKFKDTNFDHLVHGFNPRFSDGKITYDVAYPMPLVSFPSRYTNPGGSRARIPLRYNRIGRGGGLVQATVAFDFSIFKEGHWEIQFRFNGETPNFDNEQ